MRRETIDHGTVMAFLAELTALTRKHGIEIAGCGCCGSPYLWATDEEGHYKADEANGHWDCLEYVRPGEGAEQVVSPTELLRPLVNPVLLEPGESLVVAVEKVREGGVLILEPGAYMVVSEIELRPLDKV